MHQTQHCVMLKHGRTDWWLIFLIVVLLFSTVAFVWEIANFHL